jgi:hypothetical protein
MATQTEIAQGANCLCLPQGMELAAQTYLLAQLAGITDPATIMEGAKCFKCIPDGMQLPAQIFLLNELLT